ncbi:LytR/AlgR family response regulator transcription factor [Propionispora vibrioides]|uniref:Two component transcriptional regulator, LytTR family n=1 Tax=Propionispora vibrioides TaxID=112903 RepID=A0A1H8TD22_9FIRM|nr:LytTR family DNA-binding domain-containing protein [Propionispora vibrioides]SEO88484.1 two component transcriptional regulator, LytTR family [Propionispora vibrioides]
MFNVIIVDDQEGMRILLQKALQSMKDVVIVGEAENADQAVEMVTLHRPHAVFLDVEMGKKNGFDAAKRIIDITPKCMIVFVTAFEKYMPQAFELYAFDYLVKPFKMARLKETVNRMQRIQANEQEYSPIQKELRCEILIKDKEGLAIVHPNDIILIQREDRTTTIITEQGKYHTTETLSEIEAKLPENQFIRSHKSYIIQISKIHRIAMYGRWTYIVKLRGIKEDALLTKEKAILLEQKFKMKIGI